MTIPAVPQPHQPEPEQQNQPKQLQYSQKMQDAIQQYSARKIGLRELRLIQMADVTELERQGLPSKEVFVLVPLSWFQDNESSPCGLVYADYTRTKDLSQPTPDQKVPKNIQEAMKLYEKGELSPHNFRMAVDNANPTDETKLDNTIPFYVPATDQRPGTEGNNESRWGFDKEPWHNPAGYLFQGALKTTVVTAINTAHLMFTKFYSKDAFVFDDPRLKFLNEFMKKYIAESLTEEKLGARASYQRDILNKMTDIAFGIAKQDSLYRILFLNFINTILGAEIVPLSQKEKDHLKMWLTKS